LYYGLTLPNGKNHTRNNLIKDESFEDALKKFQIRAISENSCWIIKKEEIVKRNYDLSAKNPNRVKEFKIKPLKEILREIEVKGEED